MYIDRELYVKLNDYVKEKRTTVANVISRLAEEFLESKKECHDLRGRRATFDVTTKSDITFVFANDLHVRLKFYVKERRVTLVSVVNYLLKEFFDERNTKIRDSQHEDRANRSLPQVRRWARLSDDEKKVALEPLNEGIRTAREDPDFCAKFSVTQKISQNRPQIVARRSESERIAKNKLDFLAKFRVTQKIAQNQPQTVDRRSRSLRIVFNTPEVHKRRCEIQEERVRQGLHHWINKAVNGRRNVFYERILDPFFQKEVFQANVNRKTSERTLDHSALWECDYSILDIKLSIEIDEGYHLGYRERERDSHRDIVFRKDDWFVLRHWRYDIELRMERVVQMSYAAYNRQRKRYKQFRLPKLKWTDDFQRIAESQMKKIQALKLIDVMNQLARFSSLEKVA